MKPALRRRDPWLWMQVGMQHPLFLSSHTYARAIGMSLNFVVYWGVSLSLSHRPVARRACADSTSNMYGTSSKSIIDGVHRCHQFAALPCFRRIEVKLAL
jgi:hypothetical protein